MEWSAICRVCLQEGQQLTRLFADDGADTALSLKYKQCSSVELEHGTNMPEHICNECVQDLVVAYRFRTNCESSDTILRSFVTVPTSCDTAKNTDEANIVYHIRQLSTEQEEACPKEIPTVIENSSKDEFLSITEYDNILQNEEDDPSDAEAGEPVDDDVDVDDENDNSMVDFDRTSVEYIEEPLQMLFKAEPTELTTNATLSDNDDEDIVHEDETKYFELIDQPNISFVDDHIDIADSIVESSSSSSGSKNRTTKVTHIKPVKTNKARWMKKGQQLAEAVDGVEAPPGGDDRPVVGGGKTLRVKRIFNDQKPMKVCDICGNQYKYQHALDSHLRRHRNDKPFTCNICGKGFVINFELSRHMRTHTGQKPYACQFCDRKFSDFGSRIKHERIHTGERPYPCETCGKSFAYSHVLSSHMLTHTGVKNYECHLCLKRFTKSHHLKAHMNTHERNQIVAFEYDSSATYALIADDGQIYTTGLVKEDPETLTGELDAEVEEDERAAEHLISFMPSPEET